MQELAAHLCPMGQGSSETGQRGLFIAVDIILEIYLQVPLSVMTVFAVIS